MLFSKMRVLCFLLILLPSILAQIPNVVVSYDGKRIFGSSSTDAFSIEDQFGFGGEEILLISPNNESLRQGCIPFDLDIDVTDFIILFERGGTNCSFSDKKLLGETLGAKSVFITNELDLIIDEETEEFRDVCDVNCGISRSFDQSDCESSSRCDSNICLPTFISASTEDKQFCCLDEPLINIALPDLEINEVSTVSFSVADGIILKEDLSAGTLNGEFQTLVINIKERSRYVVDPSVFILIGFGTLSVSVACFLAGQDDRQLVSILWGVKPSFLKNQPEQETNLNLRGGANDPRVEKIEAVELSAWQALSMLICATVFLVVLFFMVQAYPQQVVIGIIILFGLGAIYSTSYFFIRPIVRFILPEKVSFYLVSTPKISHYVFEERYTLESLVGTVITITLVILWFVFRHQQEKVWILQNIFSVAVALLFLSSIRLNKLKTGFYFLVGFCIYDIFMVFITPFFGEGSVMLKVATAGAGGETEGSFDLNEEVVAQVCERTEDEQMPMLFLAPRFDYRGGFGLLGLGDVLIPGIFMTYIIRTDYYYAATKISALMIETGKPVTEVGPEKFELFTFIKAHFYFSCAVAAYFIALVVTFIANLQGWTINGVQGQPALLYIVPFVMILFLLQLGSKRRKFLWTKSLEDLLHGKEEPEERDLVDEKELKEKEEVTTPSV